MDDSKLHKAAFLGPKGENAGELERLLLEVLRDHVFWRRNFHPSDPRLIDERDKRSEEFDEMTARLRDKLFQILAELKRAAPLYSPRQVAHMVSDPTLPALVGYFAGLLYNQNNVVAEVSPETVREEREFFSALAQMVGYPSFLPETLPPRAQAREQTFSWGHLCSGGTIANLEALWIARNVRLYPLAVRLVTETHSDFAHFGRTTVTTAQGDEAELNALPTFELSNLPIDEITNLHLHIKDELRDGDPSTAKAFQEALPSVRKAGLASFLLSYNETFPDDRARLPKVLISQAAHYCWKKNLDLVGLGADALETVPVDDRIRLDMSALRDRVKTYAEQRRPILGIVSICGTTEEGAIDPLHEIESFRDEAAAQGITFWHHADAAFGGYFASMLPKDEYGNIIPFDIVKDDDLAGSNALIDPEVYRGIAAISDSDSLTIDPHKFGYVPYPAGAVLFRDYNVRDAISYAAPYLADDNRSGFGGFLGQWTLEGSRPGASAVSCYLSQAMVPLTPDGHGQLMKNCIAVNKTLVDTLKSAFGSDDSWIRLKPFAEPDTVGFCFFLMPRDGYASIEGLNDYTNRIWSRMTVDGREDINQYDFLLSKTDVDVASYEHVLGDVLPSDLLDDAIAEDRSLTLLRTCLMNPFLTDWSSQEPSFSDQMASFLHEIALDEYLDDALPQTAPRDGARKSITIVEDLPNEYDTLTHQLGRHDRYAPHLTFESQAPEDILADGTVSHSPVVLHITSDSTDNLLQAARRLAHHDQLVVVADDDLSNEQRASIRRLNLPTGRLIVESDTERRLQRLMARLYADEHPVLVNGS